jgi:hypothetical protein
VDGLWNGVTGVLTAMFRAGVEPVTAVQTVCGLDGCCCYDLQQNV